MPSWKSKRTLVLGIPLLALTLALLGISARVYSVIRPGRPSPTAVDFGSMKLPVQDVAFSAVDGVRLKGWLFSGDRGLPPIVLCHDHGSTKSSMVSLAITLNEAGFPVLLFDFRGHGQSAGRRSTLGVTEKRDVLGAVDYLARRDPIAARGIGLYGVGMGAYAGLMGAADRKAIRVLVLDGLYPDVRYPLVRRVYAGWDPAVRGLAALPVGIFTVLSGSGIGDLEATDVLETLVGRDLLLLAPAGDSALNGEIERMYEAIPAQPDVEGNLAVLPATQSEGLYGEHLPRHHRRVAEFFLTRLSG